MTRSPQQRRAALGLPVPREVFGGSVKFEIPKFEIRNHYRRVVYHGAMKVYTRTGDDGETSLLSGGRVKKNNHRVEAYGTVDELSSLVGLLRCESVPDDVAQHLVDVQRSLFAVGAFLADPEGRMEHDPESWEVGRLENWIDAMCSELPELRAFILPGGCRGAALAHVVRAVCRRAERRVAVLSATEAESARRRAAIPQQVVGRAIHARPFSQRTLRELGNRVASHPKQRHADIHDASTTSNRECQRMKNFGLICYLVQSSLCSGAY